LRDHHLALERPPVAVVRAKGEDEIVDDVVDDGKAGPVKVMEG
jgi:hypothetical protein